MIRYARNYLTRVIFKVDYPSIATLNSSITPNFSATISETYPDVLPKQPKQFNFTISESGPDVDETPFGFVWEHRTRDKKRAVSIAADSFIVQYYEGAFESFDAYKLEVQGLFNSFMGIYDLREVSRIGLRYVNEIKIGKGNPLDWDDLINSNLSTALKAELQDDMRLIRSMHQLHALKDDITVLINYGIFNSDFPNPVARREFVLDIDTFVADSIPA